MKHRMKIYFVGLFTVAVLLVAQSGCSSPNANNAATTQPTASPSPSADTAVALTSVSPAPAADAAGNPNAAPASSAGAANPSAATGGAAANTGAAAANPAAPAAEKPAPPRTFTLPAGTSITISTAETLSTKNDKDGTRFTASLARGITDGDWVIAKRGATVEGVVVNSDPGGRVKGRASMTVELRSLELSDGRTINLSSSSYTKVAKGTKKKDAAKIGIGAGIGAAIGAIAGGGKGAAIGAGAGGGAGTGVVLATRGDPAVIPSESQLTFKLRSPVTVTKR